MQKDRHNQNYVVHDIAIRKIKKKEATESDDETSQSQ